MAESRSANSEGLATRIETLAVKLLAPNKKGPDLSGPICMNPKLLRALSGRQGSYFFFLAGAFLAAFFAAFFVAFFID